ncbi:partial cobalt-precorrin-6B (C15)-methyltransferase, partial [uncultured bacterium]
MMIKAVLQQARQQLAGNLPPEEAAMEAQLLLRHALGNVTRAWLIAHDEQALTPTQAATFDNLIARRAQGEPVAYLLGQREFFGHALKVTPDVLIPRPDTETLVEAALEKIPAQRPCQILDLGTGSGAIAIAIALARPQAQVTAVDRSAAAIAIARENASLLGATNLALLQSDWMAGLGEARFDLIVSNPPYISEQDAHLSQGDLRFEPRRALASGQDGLNDIRAIHPQAPAQRAAGGWLMFE